MSSMDDRFWMVLIILGGFAIYVAGKVIAAMKKSERQWREADKSKLKTWVDDEDD
jgi:hypothetical protein